MDGGRCEMDFPNALAKYQSIVGGSLMDRVVNLIKYSDQEVTKMRVEAAQNEVEKEVINTISKITDKFKIQIKTKTNLQGPVF